MRVAFVGSGLMGAPMIRRLVNAGHDVHVSSRDPERLRDSGWNVVDSPAQAAVDAEIVCSILPDSPDVTSVVHEVLSTLKPGATIVEMSTHAPAVARELAAEAEAQGVSYLDCPAGGGVRAVESGILAFWVGGDNVALKKAWPILSAIGDEAKICYCGPVGSGLVLKLINNYLVAVNAIASAEALAVIRESGLDSRLAIDAITQGGGGGNWQLANLFPNRVLVGDFVAGFKLGYMVKDIRHFRELACQVNVEQAIAEATASRLSEAEGQYGSDVDFGSVARLSGW